MLSIISYLPFQDSSQDRGAGDQWRVFQRSQNKWKFVFDKTDSRSSSFNAISRHCQVAGFHSEEPYSHIPWTIFFRYYVECFIPLSVHCFSLASFRHACQTALQKWMSVLNSLHWANRAIFAEDPCGEGWVYSALPLMACGVSDRKGDKLMWGNFESILSAESHRVSFLQSLLHRKDLPLFLCPFYILIILWIVQMFLINSDVKYSKIAMKK